MKWRILFYKKENGEKPVEEFLDSLSDKHAAKVLRSMKLLEEFGPGIGSPHVENIVENIRCLRIKHGSNIFRVFFFTWKDQTLVLLHGFTKKDDKTPKPEKDRAIRYRDVFLKRKEEEEKGRETT